MPLFRPRFFTFFVVMRERLRERPDWVSRVIVFSTIAFVLLTALYINDRLGQRLTGVAGSSCLVWKLAQSIVTAKAANIATTQMTTIIASRGIGFSFVV